jgi:hypothetical protein
MTEESLTNKLDIFDEPIKEEPAPSMTQEEAEQVAADTLQHLADVGFCLWRCRALKNQIIMIARPDCEVENRSGYPVYTLKEIEMLDGSGEQHLRFINHLKKLGCTLISVERKENKVEKL